jgi:predicted nucleotidyltransferase
MKEDITLQRIKDIVLEIVPGSQIFLFGSRAKGNAESNSDYDLMVVTKKNYDVREKIIICSSINKTLSGAGIPSDVLLNSEEEVKIKKDLHGHIVRTIVREAISL